MKQIALFGALAVALLMGLPAALAQKASGGIAWMTMEEAMAASKRAPRKILIDVYTQWCGPCKTLGPILEKLTDATNGKVILAKVDVDSCPQIAQAFQVQSIPAVYAMKDGKIVRLWSMSKHFWPKVTKRVCAQHWLPSRQTKQLLLLWLIC